MIKLGKLISNSFDSIGRLLTKSQVTGKGDIQEVVTSGPFGFDSRAVKDMVAIYAQTAVSGENVVIGFINKDLITEIGESRIFSTDSNGELQTFIHLKNDGNIHFGGDNGNLTRYQELEQAFNDLKGTVNDLVSAFNTHVHPTAATGPPSTPTPVPSSIPATPSTADISGAKIDELKTL